MRADLLPFLVCPDTRQALEVAGGEVVSALNARLAGGQVRNQAGQAVAAPLEGGLLRADGRVLYPIRNGIPVLLVEEGIIL
jgi:uncharacterized protein YbaR (Trm112 family)